jgi:hypothetical protein
VGCWRWQAVRLAGRRAGRRAGRLEAGTGAGLQWPWPAGKQALLTRGRNSGPASGVLGGGCSKDAALRCREDDRSGRLSEWLRACYQPARRT